jgi:hypothetical protein
LTLLVGYMFHPLIYGTFSRLYHIRSFC